MVIRDFLPPGWRGILLGAFFAAYMSTISTQLNWGTSYVINDFYRRFLRSDASDSHYVWISRLTTILLIIASRIVTFYLESIRQPGGSVPDPAAGIGLGLILRGYWGAVKPGSEITPWTAPPLAFSAGR